MGFCPLGNSGGIFSSLHKLTRCCPMDFSNPCPQVDFPGQTWYYSSKLGNWRFRVPVFCMALRATPLQPLTRFCLLHVIARHVLAPAHTSFLLHVIASHVFAPAHTSFLLHVIANHVFATADAFLSSACHCEPVRTLVWQSVLLAVGHDRKQHFRRIRSCLRICPNSSQTG